jgi:hypothetical protein
MNQITRRRKTDRLLPLVFYVCCIALAAANGGLWRYTNSANYIREDVTDPAALSKAFDAYAAVNGLLITLATGLLAGLGVFVTSRSKQRYASREFLPAIISALLACESLFWGYVSSQNVEWAIEQCIGSLGLNQLQFPRQLQSLALLIGVFFFAEFARRTMIEVD